MGKSFLPQGREVVATTDNVNIEKDFWILAPLKYKIANGEVNETSKKMYVYRLQ